MTDDRSDRRTAFAFGSRGASDDRRERKSVFALIGELPGLISTLIRDEIEQIKREAISRLKSAGIGIALFVVAAVFLYFAAFPLLAAAVLGLGEALPLWLSALIIGVFLLLIAVVFVLIGLSRVKKGVPPVPKEAVDSVKDDVKAFKGVEQYDR
ncbi:phage holin family protein [Amnibacterium setariae]|uniref:Phage holin family protein n=1 Tax=Amnibacterium setariae TaxID=2306585 RepID=A0A3A1U6X5_9MICO|nr:phage holin family protein [Amnibacterium setariae]RIX30049.1 phage holin family protein [Amnibacterium setariae]